MSVSGSKSNEQMAQIMIDVYTQQVKVRKYRRLRGSLRVPRDSVLCFLTFFCEEDKRMRESIKRNIVRSFVSDRM